MSRQNITYRAFRMVGTAGFAACLLCSQAALGKESVAIPAAKQVEDQGQAITQARKVDLPLLKRADRVVLEEANLQGHHPPVTLTKPAEIKELRDALKPGETPPSAGETAATLTFYQGKNTLRKVWIYAGGEWGFERAGTSWTTGCNAGLWKVVQKRLK